MIKVMQNLWERLRPETEFDYELEETPAQLEAQETQRTIILSWVMGTFFVFTIAIVLLLTYNVVVNPSVFAIISALSSFTGLILYLVAFFYARARRNVHSLFFFVGAMAGALICQSFLKGNSAALNPPLFYVGLVVIVLFAPRIHVANLMLLNIAGWFAAWLAHFFALDTSVNLFSGLQDYMKIVAYISVVVSSLPVFYQFRQVSVLGKLMGIFSLLTLALHVAISSLAQASITQTVQLIAPQNISQANLLAERQGEQVQFLVAMSVGFLWLALVWFSQVVTKPINQLKDIAVQVRGGDLNAHAKVEGTDEIGLLTGAFNSMTRKLRQTLEGLEETVAERTRDLKIASERNAQLYEEQKEVSERLRALDKMKSEFLANMSHELRTPMNGVMGMTGLLLDTTLTSEQREFTETVRASSESLLTIINDILDFSKIESGKMELEEQPFDLRQCVESALDLLTTQASEKGLDLGLLLDANVPLGIAGDVTRLRQILVNLLNNSVKFTPQGEVVIEVTSRKDETESDICELQFAVRDTGIGIPKESLHKLFHSFSQVDASTTRKYGGTGLGLAISKRLVELMDGKIWVESEGVAGKGSTFFFTIRAKVAEVPPPVYLDGNVELKGKRILIVDDNETNRRIFTLQSKSWGMTPTTAANATEALNYIQRGDTFDLAILDMQMPDMNGEALAAEIRKHRDANTLPLIMLTSLGNLASPASQLFSAYLTKPIKASQLYNVIVGTLLKKPIQLREAIAESQFDASLSKRVPLRILVAEDNVVNQKLALRLLERFGYRPDIVANGLEALDALRQWPYDLILMDVQMPEMDGLEATRQIRAQGSTVHIIAMTANAMQGDREECLAAGMNDYLSKPIQVKELQTALTQAGQK